MPHSRKRDAEQIVLSSLKWSPVVGLYGLRQVGKTTVATKITTALRGEYETFDRGVTLESSREAPSQFLERKKLLCLDEAQKAPWIFPVIKDLVGTTRQPSRFLLTGSVRFTLKEDIRESLTGRIVMHELLPFTASEAHHKKPSAFLRAAFGAAGSAGVATKPRTAFDRFVGALRRSVSGEVAAFLRTGGMPVPCFARDPRQRRQWFDAYFETTLTRDVVLIDAGLSRIPFRQTLAFLKELAVAQSTTINVSELAAKSTLHRAQAARLLRALEALALFDLIPAKVRSEKAVRKVQLEWKDIGLWSYALGRSEGVAIDDVRAAHTAISQEIRGQAQFLDGRLSWSHYRGRDGGSVPWLLEESGKQLFLKYLPLESPSPYDYRIVKRLLSENPEALGILLGPDKTMPTLLDARLWLLPVSMIF